MPNRLQQILSGTKRASDQKMCDALETAAQAANPRARVWRGSIGAPLTDKASSGSGRLVILIWWSDFSVSCARAPVSSCRGSHASRICKKTLGSSSFTVRQFVPTTCFAQWIPTTEENSHDSTTAAFGITHATSCRLRRFRQTWRGTSRRSVGVGRFGAVLSVLGQLGLWQSRWSVSSLVTPHTVMSLRLWKAAWGGAYHHQLQSGTVEDTRQTEEFRARKQTRLVARSSITGRPTFPTQGLVCQIDELRPSACEFPGWTWSWSRPVHLPYMSHHEDRTTALSRCPLDRALLPVWPSTRYPWPPPCSMHKGWGLGKEEVHFWRP